VQLVGVGAAAVGLQQRVRVDELPDRVRVEIGEVRMNSLLLAQSPNSSYCSSRLLPSGSTK
jgi:hypothetical protein